MSMTIVFRCEICHKIIEDSELDDFGYGVSAEVPGCGFAYGSLGKYEVHLCRTCIKAVGPLADLLREGEDTDEVNKQI